MTWINPSLSHSGRRITPIRLQPDCCLHSFKLRIQLQTHVYVLWRHVKQNVPVCLSCVRLKSCHSESRKSPCFDIALREHREKPVACWIMPLCLWLFAQVMHCPNWGSLSEQTESQRIKETRIHRNHHISKTSSVCVWGYEELELLQKGFIVSVGNIIKPLRVQQPEGLCSLKWSKTQCSFN